MPNRLKSSPKQNGPPERGRPDSPMRCLHQQLAEDEGKDQLVLVVNLPDSEHALAFMRAAEEVELMLDNTTARVVNLSEYVEGEPPPPGSDIPGAAGWFLVGVIHGPQRSQIPVADQEAVKEDFFEECISILESHGLIEDRPSAWAVS